MVAMLLWIITTSLGSKITEIICMQIIKDELKTTQMKTADDHTPTEVLKVFPRKRPAFWPKITNCLQLAKLCCELFCL